MTGTTASLASQTLQSQGMEGVARETRQPHATACNSIHQTLSRQEGLACETNEVFGIASLCRALSSRMTDHDSDLNCVTTFKSYSFEYKWKIAEVKARLSKPEPVTCPEIIVSPRGMVPATKWHLAALDRDNGTSWYYIKLTLVSSSKVWARVTIGVRVKEQATNHDGLEARDCNSNPECYVTEDLYVSPSCDKPATVRVGLLKNAFLGHLPRDKLHKFIYDDNLIIHCRIFVNGLDTPIHAINQLPAVEIKAAPIHDLSRVLEDARHKDRYTDVTIVTEGKEFKAHKVVLATQSPFFETRLEKRWTEEGGTRIDMQDVPAVTMDTILTYMYTGKVENIDKVACELLPKAEEYQLEGLKVQCEEALSKSLTAETVIDILLMADTHNAGNLKQSCLAFLTGHITDVKKSSAWTEGRLKTKRELWVEVLEHLVNSY